jgi:DegV family protein with EDD domain
VIIVTNPGSNLPRAAIERYQLHITPQQIIVDGAEHDTRQDISFESIDGWVKGAKEHPHVIGTTAAEFVIMFRQLAKEDREILAVMTSRKIIGSHDAAHLAARTLREQGGARAPRVVVCDTGSTDLGAALCCILAGEARAAGVPIEEIAKLIQAARQHARLVFTVETLDYLVKGGRASVLRAFFADLLGVRPIIAFVDGEFKAVGKLRTRADSPLAVADSLEAHLGRGRRVWAAVFHGGVTARAKVTEAELRKRFDVTFSVVRALSPSIYLHGGPGCLGAVVLPLDALPWQPPTPAPFD